MKASEFLKRRQNFISMIGDGAIAVIANSSKKSRNRDVHFPFRSDSDFYYLVGIAEEDAIAVFVPGRKQGEYILFCREKDPKKELWDGAIIGIEGAIADFGADDAFPLDDIEDILPGLLENRHKLIYNMGSNRFLDHHLVQWINQIKNFSRSGTHAPEEIVSYDVILHEMRLIKTSAELTKIKKAADITANAHKRAMANCRPGLYEYELEAEILYEIRKSGAQSVAYSSIVAAGNNSCVLHYIDNSKKIKNGELVLIDAGAEFDYYAADVTRTFPANGKFSPAQRDLYELVLAAQNAAIDKALCGNHWDEPHQAAVTTIVDGLLELGIMHGSTEEVIEKKLYRKYFMHRAGHWLGMDVHDVGEYKISGKWRLLESGMLMTVEPGIYIAADDTSVDKVWRGMGIRIEDDIIIRKNGNQILTDKVPRDIAAIEDIMA